MGYVADDFFDVSVHLKIGCNLLGRQAVKSYNSAWSSSELSSGGCFVLCGAGVESVCFDWQKSRLLLIQISVYSIHFRILLIVLSSFKKLWGIKTSFVHLHLSVKMDWSYCKTIQDSISHGWQFRNWPGWIAKFHILSPCLTCYPEFAQCQTHTMVLGWSLGFQ